MVVAQNEVSLQEGKKIPNLNSHFVVSVTECGLTFTMDCSTDHLPAEDWLFGIGAFGEDTTCGEYSQHPYQVVAMSRKGYVQDKIPC